MGIDFTSFPIYHGNMLFEPYLPLGHSDTRGKDYLFV